MVQQMDELLKELGWADGFHVPVADKDNKQLENEIEALIREKADLILNFDAYKESVNALKQQIKNYETEQNENQTIITARRNQMENEYTRLRLAEFEYAKVKDEINKSNKGITELETKQESLQMEIDRMMYKLDKLKTKVQGGEEALASLNEICTRGCDDNAIIEDFCKEDEARFQELEYERVRLRTELSKREDMLNSIASEKLALEFQMQQCGKLYRHGVEEYKEFCGYWDISLKFLNIRRKKLNGMCKEISDIKKETFEMFKEIHAKNKFKEIQTRNNKEVASGVADLERKSRVIKEALIKTNKECEEFSLQIHLLQGTLSSVGSELQQSRSLSSTSCCKLEAKESDIERAREYHINLLHQYEKLKSEANTQVNCNHQLEEIINEVEKAVKLVTQDCDKLNKQLADYQNLYAILKDKALIRINEISNYKSAAECLGKEIKDINREIVHQQEILYKSKFDLSQILCKISVFDGERDIFVREQNLKKIHELEGVLKEKTEAYNLINGQVKQTEDDRRRLTVEFEKGEIELLNLLNACQDRSMNVEGGQKKLLELKDVNQELQVEQNLLLVRVNHMEKNITKQDETVFNLEKQQLEIEAAMKERRLHIQAERDILIAKRKTLQEERSDLKRTIEHLIVKRQQVQTRYEMAADMLGKADESVGTSGEYNSLTYCKIKLAQEKTELEQKGNELDSKIRKSEKEILAMENTLRVLQSTNDSYKHSLTSVDEDSPEMQEKNKLELKYVSLTHELKQEQGVVKNLDITVQELEASLADTAGLEENLQLEWKTKDKEVRELDRELEEQQKKLNRAEKLYKKTLREAQSVQEPPITFELTEKDIETRELQDINNNAIQMLLELAERYVETGPVVKQYLEERGLATKSLHKLKTKQSSLLSLSPSTSDLGCSSSRLSVVSERSAPSIINLDPFGSVKANAGLSKDLNRDSKSRTSGNLRKKSSSSTNTRDLIPGCRWRNN